MTIDPNVTGQNGQVAPETQSFAEVVAEGDLRQSLEALRDKLAADMDGCDSKVVAQVAAQLRAVLKEIAALPDAKKVTKADELSRRRAQRRATAGALPPAAGESQ